MEQNASSYNLGRIDQYLLPYYEADLKAGRIDALVGDKTFIEYILANKADEAETTK